MKVLAAEARSWFRQFSRPNGEKYWHLSPSDKAPEWVCSIVRQAHGDFLPDDWRYQFLVDALDAIAEEGEEATVTADWDAWELLPWLASSDKRLQYCNRGIRLCGGMRELLAFGQQVERDEVLRVAKEHLSQRKEP